MKRISDIGRMFSFRAYEPRWSPRELDVVWRPFMDYLNQFDPYHTMKLWVYYTSPSISMGGIIYSGAKITLRL